jgi:hypothetical protein
MVFEQFVVVLVKVISFWYSCAHYESEHGGCDGDDI